jgi:hypothetical protein
MSRPPNFFNQILFVHTNTLYTTHMKHTLLIPPLEVPGCCEFATNVSSIKIFLFLLNSLNSSNLKPYPNQCYDALLALKLHRSMTALTYVALPLFSPLCELATNLLSRAVGRLWARWTRMVGRI